ncbi:N-6 DNA methylase [Anaerocolumna xylanovorans]|uniref:N-6 DNA Methylase n=1 Tax=Anaerocolumna xylanovorans DSM 12503 TaxID=1121345 RepID=A0A1M7Y7V9_9FIRM|nr:N-6 DNA methylase [Anaerocolumna xylanovorans]SHO48713.1 N-6 DNA Methylase [Anaerocolumna xylanovorans DSM 12503]
MGTIVRRNERSWAIEIITQINLMLQGLGLKIKCAGGESTISVNKKSMFPDVLLFEDEAQNRRLQGWELKMPDVLITDEALIKDAARKAKALGLNSFVIWNFTYGKLYIKGTDDTFYEAKAWTGTGNIKTRPDVTTYKNEWVPVIRDIIMTVNEYLVNGEISTAPITEALTDNLLTEIVQRNKGLVAENLRTEVSNSMIMERKMKVWWNAFQQEYEKDETNMYSAYAKTILINWANRIMFANLIKKYHNCADLIKYIDNSTSPEEGNEIIDQIISQGDFYNVFHKIDYNDLIPEDTWVDIIDYNQFLYNSKVENIDQSVLQDLLEGTVNTAKREIRGQFSTPFWLADLLCQITVENWNGHCADLCSGTGTIAKAIINNKMNRLKSAEDTFATTWISDKHAYPLQISNIALTSIESLNIPINMFQSDIFDVEAGKEVIIKNPADGLDLVRQIPAFSAVISNFPFVKYNNIASDEYEHIKKCADAIKVNTGISFKLGKTDLYMFLPFKIYELLEENGRLGIILSNSWLGTDVGKDFYNALLYYYDIQSVVLSNCGRWFENADVVATLLVMQKKKISLPDKSKKINFCLTQKELKNLDSEQLESLISCIVLKEELDSSLIKMKSYTVGEIISVLAKGISLNALFHNIDWMQDINEKLIPISDNFTMVRGERKGWNDMFYINGACNIETDHLVPMLKTPRNIKNFIAEPDRKAFCCKNSIDELKSLGHEGALKWIEKFSGLCNEKGKPLTESIHHTQKEAWYQMSDDSKADFVTAINPDKRLFVAKLAQQALIDQRLTALAMKDNTEQKDLLFALLNSLYGMFAIEAIGFGRGLGVLDASKDRFARINMINPKMISEEDKKTIIELFHHVVKRGVMDVERELKDEAREKFDREVLRAIGKEHLYEDIKNSILSMQKTRQAVNNKYKQNEVNR